MSNNDEFIVTPGKKIKLSHYDPRHTGDFKDKSGAKEALTKSIKELSKYQGILYAQATYSLLVVIQAMDAGGKDSAIEHIMSGVNPQGCQIYSFKEPSSEDLAHDFLWRCYKVLPERGRIGIFNRSYYEEVLVVRVHPELLEKQRLPEPLTHKVWKHRYESINDFERHIVRNGTVVLKFFLNVSKEEQKRRFLSRIDTAEKNWKFSMADVRERALWDEYMKAYELAFSHTSTEWAPWYVIPADHKWYSRTLIADIIVNKLKSLDLVYPSMNPEHMQELQSAKEILESES